MSRRKFHINKVTVSLSCGCMKPKLSDIFNPKPKISVTKQSKYPTTSQSHCSYYDESPNMKSPLQASVGGRFGRTGGEGVAVEKDSDDPYLDFKHSMLQMILENEIYTKDDLRELLNCFLQLNSPYHHGIIIRAFSEIWNGVFSASPSVKRVRRSKARQAAAV
ncbi:hypothetical protein QQ045_017137 [Rhodiola kirilowii]